MTKTTLQKLTLTTMSLLATLALSAQGAGSGQVSSSRNAPPRNANPFHQLHVVPNVLDSTYQYDDGTSEQGIGFGNGSQNFSAVWLNQFAVIPGDTTITAVEVVWGSPVAPGFAPNGTPVTIGVWSDPDGDGQPFDSTLLGSVNGTVQNSDTDTFVTYTFATPVDLPAGATSFFIGDVTPMNNGPQQFWQGQDTSDNAPNKSWAVAMSSGADVDINNLGNNDFIFTIDSQGLPGNWLIRGDAGGGGGGDIVLTAKLKHGANMQKFVQLTYTGTDGSGTVDILENGNVIHSKADNGRAQVPVGSRESDTFQVCETGTSNCSNTVTVQVK